jgi:hypothetical protein
MSEYIKKTTYPCSVEEAHFKYKDKYKFKTMDVKKEHIKNTRNHEYLYQIHVRQALRHGLSSQIRMSL